MAVYYEHPRAYIESSSSRVEQIEKIDTIINCLLDAAIKAATGEEVGEYSLDDGQTKIRSVSRSTEEIAISIERMKSLKNILIKDINGHIIQLKDHNSLTGL